MSEGVVGRGVFFLLFLAVAGAGIVTDGQNDAEIHPRNQVRRTTFGDEWERLSRDRCQSYGHSHIGQGLNEQNDADPHHDKGRWSAGTLLGYVIGADEKTHIEQEDKGTAEDAELFADDGENEVGISGRKVVALHRASRAAADDSAACERNVGVGDLSVLVGDDEVAWVLGTFVASLQTRAPGGEALRHGTVRSPVEPKRTQQGNGANREVSQAFQEVAPWHIADEQNGKDGHDEHEGRREVLCGDDAER